LSNIYEFSSRNLGYVVISSID